jgi:hypothetical protein
VALALAVAVKLQPCHSQLTLYASNIPLAVCIPPPEDEQVMLETCRGPDSQQTEGRVHHVWFNFTDTLRCTVSKTLNYVYYISNVNAIVTTSKFVHSTALVIYQRFISDQHTEL